MLKRIRQISLLAAIVGALFIVRSLPVDSGIDVLTQWVVGKGIWGPMVYGLAYVTPAAISWLEYDWRLNSLENAQ